MRVNGVNAAEKLSRGQVKLFICALLAAHVKIVSSQGHETPVLLVDDVRSELDANATGRLMSMLQDLDSQLFVTTTGLTEVSRDLSSSGRVFHVEQGAVRVMV